MWPISRTNTAKCRVAMGTKKAENMVSELCSCVKDGSMFTRSRVLSLMESKYIEIRLNDKEQTCTQNVHFVNKQKQHRNLFVNHAIYV